MDGAKELTHIETVPELGCVIRRFRKELGLTQVGAAQAAGVGPRFWGELENGKQTVRLGSVLQVLKNLGMGLYIERPVQRDEELENGNGESIHASSNWS